MSTLKHDIYPAIDPVKTDLRGKSVFVSGASKRVGRAAAISFVKAGVAAIAITARSDLSSLEREMHEAATAAGKPIPHQLNPSRDPRPSKRRVRRTNHIRHLRQIGFSN